MGVCRPRDLQDALSAGRYVEAAAIAARTAPTGTGVPAAREAFDYEMANGLAVI